MEAEAAVRNMIGSAYWMISDYEPAITQLEAAYELMQRLPNSDPGELRDITSIINMALREAQQGEPAAQRWMREGEKIDRRFLREEYPALGRAVDEMTKALIKPWHPTEQEMLAHLNNVMAAYAAAMPADHPDGRHVADMLVSMSTYYGNTFRGPEARPFNEAALTILRRVMPRTPEELSFYERRKLGIYSLAGRTRSGA